MNNGTNNSKNKNTMKFSNAKMKIHAGSLVVKQHDENDDQIGRLVDSGAPYSAIGIIKLAVLSRVFMRDWNSVLNDLTTLIGECSFWPYSTGEHRLTCA